MRVALIFLAAVLLFSLCPAGRQFWQAAFLATGLAPYPQKTAAAPLKIHVLDVGKADAVLLECGGKTALVDGGTYAHAAKVEQYLSACGITSLDMLIATHADADHIGGMAPLLERIPVGEFLYAGDGSFTAETPEYTALLQRLQEKKVVGQPLQRHDSIFLGDSVLTVLGPVRMYEDTNNASLVLHLNFKEFSALFCGDIEEEAELHLVKAEARELSATLLKVPHHGSDTSSTNRFLQQVMPRYAVISVGPDRNNLPRPEALTRLEQTGAQLFRTDEDGTVVFSTDGKDCFIETEKGN